jgi:hypothetical protein
MRGTFCAQCAEKEAEIEILRNKYFTEVECMKKQIEKLQSENEALIMDVAFYGGSMINLSCNNK